MLKLLVKRTIHNDTETLGTFEVIETVEVENPEGGTTGGGTTTVENILLTGATCEPKGPDTITQNKNFRIPEGAFSIYWRPSSRAGASYNNNMLPCLYNGKVSKDRYILLHIGNSHKDTRGCILIGTEIQGKTITKSTAKFKELLDIIRDKEFTVEVINILPEPEPEENV